MEDWDYSPDGRLDVDALIGWTSFRLPAGRGCLVRLETAHSSRELGEGRRRAAQLSITANQARLLGTYLCRLADEIDGHVPDAPAARSGWWR